jgi:hypothetical protein
MDPKKHLLNFAKNTIPAPGYAKVSDMAPTDYNPASKACFPQGMLKWYRLISDFVDLTDATSLLPRQKKSEVWLSQASD